MKPKSLPVRLFGRSPSSASGEAPGVHPAEYQRHVDRADHPERLEEAVSGDGSGRGDKCPREIHFAFLAERYEPLVDDEDKVKAKEEKKRRKKESYKKVKKYLFGYDPECWQGTAHHMEVFNPWPIQLCPGLLYSNHSGSRICP
ncbi:uncharacterized protein C1orf115-like isoform X2 [Mugil cephalus]|uniref:uncharacterized protein C1orf115-like isoform X2 n=1 Tax=Mugil cephalus TaxID=48193 RepID=UPI001FB7D02A|nr:uncharacterized protein C1orf115-like isoform X2 [Mugil cephalus]